ncbi:uncharacterized protein B0P05DRAFT_520762, partial [Gilbertella persicaria]|uniref:uncharacterized protein n=1 Tax=Gilbertella persicaria TaxID=101096 RepID=UPI00221FFE41
IIALFYIAIFFSCSCIIMDFVCRQGLQSSSIRHIQLYLDPAIQFELLANRKRMLIKLECESGAPDKKEMAFKIDNPPFVWYSSFVISKATRSGLKNSMYYNIVCSCVFYTSKNTTKSTPLIVSIH